MPTGTARLPAPTRPVPNVVRRGGEAELRARDAEAERGALVEVRQQLGRPDERGARIARPLRERLARLERAVRDGAVAPERRRNLLGGPGGDPQRLATARIDGPDVEAAAGERACGVSEEAPVATPCGHGDDLVAARQPPQATTVATDDVEARRTPAAVLPDESDSAPVGRPVRFGVGPVSRNRAVTDIEIAVARGDDELRQSPRGLRVPVPGDAGKQRQRRQGRCDQEKPSSARHAAVWCPTGADGRPVPPPNAAAPSARVATGPTQTSSPSKSRNHSSSERVGERRRELCGELLLRRGVEVALRELRPADHLAEPDEELGLERADRQVPAIGGRVDPVAGEATREEARLRVAAEPVRDELVRAVRHRDVSRAPRPVRSRSSTAASTSTTAPSAPAARSAGCSGGSPGAVSSSTPAQPR